MQTTRAGPSLGQDVWGRDARRLRTELLSGREVCELLSGAVSDVAARRARAIASWQMQQRARARPIRGLGRRSRSVSVAGTRGRSVRAPDIHPVHGWPCPSVSGPAAFGIGRT